jgi:SAM-dependent methyltransferase
MKEQDLLNQGSYTQPDAMKWFETMQGFCDPGERSAYWRIVDEVRGQPILDLGVGAGRTITLLRPLTEKYTAIDYLPEMVASVRSRYPFIDISLGDARDLSRFADHSFALVAFSFNGIDSIDHDGRRRVLQEVQRVLKPGGIFWFSTLNRDGPSRRQRPWRPRRPSEVGGRRAYPMVALRSLWQLPRSTINYLRADALRQQGDGWEISVLDAHSYGLMVHYTTLSRQLVELAEAGFRPDPEVFSADGSPIEAGSDLRRAAWFQILART